MSYEVDQLFEVGMGFMASKALLAAVKLELFTKLDSRSMTGTELGQELGLHPRGLRDYFDVLHSLKFLNREGAGTEAKYSNTPTTGAFLNKKSEQYIGGIFELCNDQQYHFWANLEDSLKTGTPQQKMVENQESMFESTYSSQEKMELFLKAMENTNEASFIMLAKKFDFTPYQSLCDVGGANGHLSIQLAKKNGHLNCKTIDLDKVRPVAEKNIKDLGVENQVEAIGLDIFKMDLPKADVITMANFLHDWDEEKKKYLIQKAYNALPEGGAFIAVENIIDDERKHNIPGLMISLNMLVESDEGSNFTKAEFDRWTCEAGFRKTEIMPLNFPDSAVIAYK